MVAHLGNHFGQIGGPANQPKVNQFGNFTTISCKKCKLKGALFLAENCQLMYLGPNNAGRFGQMGMSANRLNWGPISKYFNNFLYKVQIEKNCHLIYLRPYNTGRFKQIRVSDDHPKMTNFAFF